MPNYRALIEKLLKINQNIYLLKTFDSSYFQFMSKREAEKLTTDSNLIDKKRCIIKNFVIYKMNN